MWESTSGPLKCKVVNCSCIPGRVGTYVYILHFLLSDVVPDIVTIGKPMGNGHPVSAVIITKEVAEKLSESGLHYFNTVREI